MATETRFAASGAALRVPALCALPGGRLLLVHDVRPEPTGQAWRQAGGALPDDLPNPNSLVSRLSVDGGRTWQEPRALSPGLAGIVGVSDPSLLFDPVTKVVHLFAAGATDVGLFGARPPSRPASSPPEPGTLRLLHATSRDGEVWVWRDLSDVALPGPHWPSGAVVFPVSGHGVALTSGRLVQPVVAALAPEADGSRPLRSVCLLSDDSGGVWYLGQPVPGTGEAAASLAGGAATNGTDEHAVAECPSGELLMSSRDGAYGGTRLQSRSFDGGLSWCAPERRADLPDPGCNAGLLSHDGELLLVHASDSTTRRAGRLSVSSDEGVTWQTRATVGAPEEPFGYSDLAIVDGQLVVVYEQEGDLVAHPTVG